VIVPIAQSAAPIRAGCWLPGNDQLPEYRILYSEDRTLHPLAFLQVSAWHFLTRNSRFFGVGLRIGMKDLSCIGGACDVMILDLNSNHDSLAGAHWFSPAS
jgi:hypothetical protein